MIALKDQLGDQLIEARQELASAKATIERLSDNIGKLLASVAQYSRPCRGCQMLLWFVYMQKTGKYQVYEADGKPHWGSCKAADQFRKKAADAK